MSETDAEFMERLRREERSGLFGIAHRADLRRLLTMFDNARRGVTHDAGADEVTDAMVEAFGEAHYEDQWQTLKFGIGDVTVTERIRKGLRAALSARVRDDGAGMMRALEIVAKHEARSHDPWQVQQDIVGEIEEELRTAAPEQGADDGWRDDPSADDRWNAGCDFAMTQLCALLEVDPEKINWDAATETLDGDVRAVLWNILRARLGENWSFPPTSVSK